MSYSSTLYPSSNNYIGLRLLHQLVMLALEVLEAAEKLWKVNLEERNTLSSWGGSVTGTTMQRPGRFANVVLHVLQSHTVHILVVTPVH